MTVVGFPHSDIHGSILACSSPWLFAAYRVLHRLLAPRHPPYALSSLTFQLLRTKTFLVFCLFYSLTLSCISQFQRCQTVSSIVWSSYSSVKFSRYNEGLSKPSKLNNTPNVLPFILRKEVIQPHLPIRLPCYDFTPIIYPTLGGWLQKVTSPTSGVTNSRGVTGGVYKARERIHRGVLIRDY